MSAPYWGQLPGPKIAQAHHRRNSETDDYGYNNADRRQSLEIPPVRKNRASVQTTHSQAPTESTFSPYEESPTASNFTPEGLAPRPPSYNHAGRRDVASDTYARRSRRRSRNLEEFDNDDALSPSLPTAPEVPRGPPVSYRHPYGNGGLPYTVPSSGSAAPPQSSNPPPHDDDMDGDYYYSRGPGRSDSQDHGSAPTDHRRVPSGTSGRRRKFADDRSPLQRLELTLDSITKEEKRARVEAAEQRARNRAALRTGQPAPAQVSPEQPAPEPQVRFHERKPSISHGSQRVAAGDAVAAAAMPPVARQPPRDEPRGTYVEPPREKVREAPREAQQEAPRVTYREPPREVPREAPVYRQESSHHRGPLTQHPPEETRHYGLLPEEEAEEPLSAKRHVEADAGIPKRNLSFRERAARDNVQFNNATPRDSSDEPTPPPAASGGFSLTRSGSNKLKKDPPAEYRYAEPEKRKKSVVEIEQGSRDPVEQARNAKPQPEYLAEQTRRAKPQPEYQYAEPEKRSNSVIANEQRFRNLPEQARNVEPNDAYYTPRERGPSLDFRRQRQPQIGTATRNYGTSGRDYPEYTPEESQTMRRRATEPAPRQDYESEEEEEIAPPPKPKFFGLGRKLSQKEPPKQKQAAKEEDRQDAAASKRRAQRADSLSSESLHDHHVSNMVFKRREDMTPGNGLYKPPKFLNEWKKGTVGTLGGTLLDVHASHAAPPEPGNKAWWEKEGQRGNHPYGARPRKAEAFDGEYDENAPTRFKPALYLKCGPLLRYTGLRKEKVQTRTARGNAMSDRELWRGSVMIVTQDADSSYEIAPTLRLFVQDVELLPPPPHSVKGELSPEYVDPIAGHPKIGRRGETVYVRPVEHLEEAKDLSRDETDEGLFEQSRSPPDIPPKNGEKDLPGSFASRRKRVGIDGEKVQKYKDVRGFRLHAERGNTFWRFNIEVELREKQQRIAYRINRGPATGFWVPARGETMNMMFYSCNGFSLSVKPDELSGPDPMWRDVLNNHQTRPFHLMIGGGDQIYNDCVADDCALFGEWLDIRNPVHKHTAALTPEIQEELETFYLERYCMWFSQGLFGMAISQIPMVNMYDDHDIFDGYGSYPHHYMNSPIFRGLGAIAFKYYMLFQQQSIMDETEATEPSWILGEQPGPYIGELSRSLFMHVGSKAALLAVDCRTERTEHDVVSDATWEKIVNRLYAEVRRGQVEHLLVLVGIPVAYPRLVWLENILTSRAMGPVKALGRMGMFGKKMNNIDGGVEVLDDLNDHWTAKNHKQERSVVIEDLQDLAIDKSLRITLLSGDVHLAAVGRFYSNPQLGLAKHKDPRYMPNIVSSAIANTPPPDIMADVLNKRNKIHHFDKQTDEDMIPMFPKGVDGKPRNNKHLLPHRNWCSIREWDPGHTPPPTPPGSSHERSPSPPPPPPASGGGGLLRRFSLSKNRPSLDQQRPEASRDSVRGPKPPVTRGNSIFRHFSKKGASGGEKEKPEKLTRSMSVDHGEPKRKGGLFGFGRRNSQSSRDEEGVQGRWGDDNSEDDDRWFDPPPPPSNNQARAHLRGGAAYDEYSEGDESYFSARPPPRSQTLPVQPAPLDLHQPSRHEAPPTRPFYRTPTGLSAKQMKKPEKYEVDLEGGLDICINVEVNPKDPTGITVPYRLLVPKLLYEYDPATDEIPTAAPTAGGPAPPAQPSGFKRLLSFKKKPPKVRPPPEDYDYDSEEEGEYRRDNYR